MITSRIYSNSRKNRVQGEEATEGKNVSSYNKNIFDFKEEEGLPQRMEVGDEKQEKKKRKIRRHLQDYIVKMFEIRSKKKKKRSR